MRYFFLCFAALAPLVSFNQELTGLQLLDKAIKYHDPSDNWTSFHGNLGITMSTPDGKKRVSDITINHPKEYFQVIAIKEGIEIAQTLNKGECELKLNGSTEISEEDKKTHRLTCERAHMYKNYKNFLKVINNSPTKPHTTNIDFKHSNTDPRSLSSKSLSTFFLQYYERATPNKCPKTLHFSLTGL